MNVRLRVDNLHKTFGGVTALRGVTLEVRDGEILGIIGPNGAGKTTLFNVITGVVRPDAGEVLLDGRPITGLPVHAVAQLGLVRTFQITRVFKRLSVLTNMLLAVGAGMFRHPIRTLAMRPSSAHYEKARALLAEAGLDAYAGVPAGTLPLGLQRRLELHRALATCPTLVLLDEPVAGLTPAEAAEFASLLRRLQRQGQAFAVVEHNMPVAMEMCDRMVVLHHGAVIAEGPPVRVRQNQAVVEAYLGPE